MLDIFKVFVGSNELPIDFKSYNPLAFNPLNDVICSECILSVTVTLSIILMIRWMISVLSVTVTLSIILIIRRMISVNKSVVMLCRN